ncbi:unnamed protein product [Sphagnum balticum]
MGSSAHSPHVVVFPFPVQGHIRPFVHFSKRLAADNNKIQLACFCLPAEYAEVTSDNFLDLAQSVHNLQDSFAKLMKKLMMGSSSSACTIVPSSAMSSSTSPSHTESFQPPVCIISDMFLGWTQDTADEFKVANYCLSSTPTHFISLLCRLPELNVQGCIPARANGQPYTIPGFPPIAPLDLPRTLQGDQKKSEFLVYHGACLWRATGFLVNSVYELEASIIEGLQDMLQTGCQVPRVLTIGPLLEGLGEGDQALQEKLQVEQGDNECLKWLSKQSTEVLYVCFGTITMHGKEQMCELALGLEASGVHFLWVVRTPEGEKSIVATLLPKGFLERTKERGLVYFSWAPQLQILAHPMVKGFLTHCGWNSIMESIAMGVPMIGWPNDSDQMMNCQLCVDLLKIAVAVKKSGEFEEVVGRMEVERVVRLFTKDQICGVLKTKVEELGVLMKGVQLEPQGSSRKNLDLFVNLLNSMTLNNS